MSKPATPTTEKTGQLRGGILGIADALAQSVALLSLALGVAFASSAAAGETGAAVPLAYLIAGIGSLCLASVIIRFTRRMASAGGLYTYIARGLDPNAGFIGGWLYAGGFAVGISFVLVIASFFLSIFFDAHTSITLSWGWCFVILLILLALLAFLDIRVSTRTQLLFAALGVAAVLLLAFAILFQGGDSGISLQPFNPSQAPNAQGLFLAVVLAFTGFIGFEAAAVLGEETADPLRAIPRAILAAVLVAIVYYVFVTWMMSVGYGVDNSAAWAKDPAALDTLATRYVGNWLSVIIDFAVAASGFVAALGGLHLTSRTLFAMGREGGLPRAFAWTHPRFRTPWVGIATGARAHRRARCDPRTALRPADLLLLPRNHRNACHPRDVHPRRGRRDRVLPSVACAAATTSCSTSWCRSSRSRSAPTRSTSRSGHDRPPRSATRPGSPAPGSCSGSASPLCSTVAPPTGSRPSAASSPRAGRRPSTGTATSEG